MSDTLGRLEVSDTFSDTTLTVPKLEADRLNLYYGTFQALKDVAVRIQTRRVTAIIGPSGCGKSTLLRCFNRMNDLIDGCRVAGELRLDGVPIYGNGLELTALRKRVGMVFQRPNPFPLTIRENLTFGPEVHGQCARSTLDGIVEASLRAVELWTELRDTLQRSALSLSLEQQQRLCIARLLTVQPEVLLMDEPCSALDPVATAKIEELIYGLKRDYAIVIVTHNMQQAARVSDEAGMMLLGELIEFGATAALFTKPHDARTEAYLTGRFG